MFIPVLIFFFLVIIPALACRYAKRIRNLGNVKYLLCLYNAVVMTSWTIVLSLPNLLNLFTSIYFHGIFWPCFIASVIAVSSSENINVVDGETETPEAEVITE